MGFKGLFKSTNNQSDTAEALNNLQNTQESDKQAEENLFIASVNRGLPVEVLQDYNTPLLMGRIVKMDEQRLVLDRIPEATGFPILEKGSSVLVRGYDKDVNPIIVRAQVVRSSEDECVFEGMEISPYVNKRKSVRIPLTPPANIHAHRDIRKDNPEPCQLVNISTGGACIVSVFAYEHGHTLHLQVKLLKDSDHITYECQVVRATQRPDGQYEYGLLFTNLEQREQDEIARIISKVKKDTELRLLS